MTAWEQAECRSTDPEVFFPAVTHRQGMLREARRQARVAAAICRSCPLQVECLTWAVEHKVDDGVRGGVWFHNGRRDDGRK
jgi:WhiB family redox-sensing transcriptional regulator